MIGQRLNVTLSEIRRIRETISSEDLLKGVRRSKILNWIPPSIDSRNIFSIVQENAPLAPDVAPWMQEATANLAVLQGAAENYKQAGSDILVDSGDGYIPGVESMNFYAVSTNGEILRSQGFGQVVAGDQVYNVQAPGKSSIIGPNFVGWAAITDIGTGIQWVMNLMNWTDLASTPITSKVFFPVLSGASASGLTAPQFFVVSTALPTPIQQLFINLESDKAQTVNVKGRSMSNFVTELFALPVDIQEGETTFTILVRSFPVVSPYVLEIQPQDDTQSAITNLTTRPM